MKITKHFFAVWFVLIIVPISFGFAAPESVKKAAKVKPMVAKVIKKQAKVDKKKLSKGERSQGKILFERNFGCISCHRALNLVGKLRGGVSGPSMVNAGLRLNPDWVFNWLKNPKKFFSESGMPLYDLNEETAVLVTKYILSIRTSP